MATQPVVRLGDNANVPADGHGCPGCAHNCTGPFVKGCSQVFANGMPVVTVGHNGVHSACCGANTFQAVQGSPTVFAEGQPVHCKDAHQTQHCGGVGTSIAGSPDVVAAA